MLPILSKQQSRLPAIRENALNATINVINSIRDYIIPATPMHGWTVEHDALLQELVHHTMPGGFNEKNPPLSWKEIGEGFHLLQGSRGLGNKCFPWGKIAARYYDHIRPQYQKLDQELAMNTARNTGRNPPGKGKGEGKVKEVASAEERDGHEFFEELEDWGEASEGTKNAGEEGVGKEGFFDIMEKLDKEELIAKKK
jgi:hypothetical protein